MARSPANPQLVLRPNDLVVLLRLALDPGPAPIYAAIGTELVELVHLAGNRDCMSHWISKSPSRLHQWLIDLDDGKG